MKLDYDKAKENFLASQFEGCQKFFAEHGCFLELAYYEIISDNLPRARELFNKIKEIDIRADWGLYLVSMIEHKASRCPTYFELRNFLEIDLNILIQNGKGQYVQNILGYSEFMSQINPEVYKFIGRVFYNNGLKEEGMYVFEKAKEIFYQDPELHYLIALAYKEKGDNQKALHYAKTCQEILPEYCPAVMLEKTLQSVEQN